MNTKESEITLIEQAYLIKEVQNATFIYTATLISPTSEMENAELGSGTFAYNSGIKGILTNDHVAKIFINKKLSHVRLLNNISATPSIVKFELIIKLPALGLGHGIDLAFIILHSSIYETITGLGKQFWNLDLSVTF